MTRAPFPTFSKYEIIGVLGHGSMGTVYKAHHIKLGRVVALKVPRPDLMRSNMSAERFLREGQALAMLQHPHIVSVYDADEENGLPYIAIEYVDSGTLRSHISENKQISISEVLSWGIQMAQALDYIHNKGILHRDLKSSNVLISNEGQARITDFGIARLDSHATITSGMIGTPAYMSPEQAKGKLLDQRSDIYSLGVILYEALTGHIPFMEENGLALIQRIIHDTPALVNTYREDTPPWLARIVHRCLEKNPSARYQSALLVLKDLQDKKPQSPGIHTLKKAPFTEKVSESLIQLKSFLTQYIPSIMHQLREVFKLIRLRRLIKPPLLFILIGVVVFATTLWVLSASTGSNEIQPVQKSETAEDSTEVDTTTAPQNRPTWQPWPE